MGPDRDQTRDPLDLQSGTYLQPDMLPTAVNFPIWCSGSGVVLDFIDPDPDLCLLLYFKDGRIFFFPLCIDNGILFLAHH